jgi:hypothetical protein
MPKSGTATSNASIPYLMGRNLGSCCGVEAGECIIVNHREVLYVAFRALGASRRAGRDVEHTPECPEKAETCGLHHIPRAKTSLLAVRWGLRPDNVMNGLARLLGCHSRFTSTCCGVRRDTHWRPGEWIHGGSSTS